jgi:hypothetical protein
MLRKARAATSTDMRHLCTPSCANKRPHSPPVAGHQGDSTTHTGGLGIGQHSSHPTAATVGGAGAQVSLTAIAGVLIAVAKPAGSYRRGAGEERGGRRETKSMVVGKSMVKHGCFVLLNTKLCTLAEVFRSFFLSTLSYHRHTSTTVHASAGSAS